MSKDKSLRFFRIPILTPDWGDCRKKDVATIKVYFMKKKKIVAICVWGAASVGKTSVVRKVFELLETTRKEFWEDLSGRDICCTAEYKGKHVGFCSQGDPDGEQFEVLPKLVKDNCDIVVCASRTKWSTVDLVTDKNLFDKVVWVRPLHIDPIEKNEEIAEHMNIFSAKSIIKIIDKLI